MAINKNHEFEELNGVKCAIVEKNILQERVDFLKEILGINKYTVIVVPNPPPKVAAPPPKPSVTTIPEVTDTQKAAEVLTTAVPETPPPPATFTLGVTDVSFNAINAIFGRLLKTKEGRIVTLAYWQQKEKIANDEVPYFDKKF